MIATTRTLNKPSPITKQQEIKRKKHKTIPGTVGMVFIVNDGNGIDIEDPKYH